MEKTGYTAAKREGQRPPWLVQGLNVSFIHFMDGEEHGVGRTATQLHHGPSFPEIGQTAERLSTLPLVIDLGSNVKVVAPDRWIHLSVGFYIVEGKQQKVLGYTRQSPR